MLSRVPTARVKETTTQELGQRTSVMFFPITKEPRATVRGATTVVAFLPLVSLCSFASITVSVKSSVPDASTMINAIAVATMIAAAN